MVRRSLTAEPANASVARRFVEETLDSWHCAHLTDDADLLITELVTNALLHASSTIEVTLALTSATRFRVEVHDEASEPPRVAPADPEATGGRGLTLVDHLASAWGVTPEGNGKSVWFELVI